MSENIKENVKDTGVWMRLLFMLLFVIFYSVAELLLAAIVFFQFLVVLFTGKKNDKALVLGAQLATYVYQVFRYLTYNSEERPYPFADWPSGEAPAKQAPAKQAEQAEKPAAPRRGRPRKQQAAKEEKPEAPAGTPPPAGLDTAE